MPIQRVLLVDPDETARSTGRALLERAGWDIVAEADPAAALARVESFRPDVLLLDAGLAGAGFLARLRENPAGARAAVLVAAAGRAAPVPGTAGVVAKPFAAEALARQVQELYEAARLDYQLARLDDIGGPEFVREMIALFLEHSPPRLEAAWAALAAHDLPAVARAVHPLKSSAGNVGADAVQGLAERIEQQATAGVVDALPALLAQLDNALRSVSARLQAIRGPGGG